MDGKAQTPEILLARINYRLEETSRAQHRLAVVRTVLQEQATALRLGVSPAAVRIALERAGISTLDAESDAQLDAASGWR